MKLKLILRGSLRSMVWALAPLRAQINEVANQRTRRLNFSLLTKIIFSRLLVQSRSSCHLKHPREDRRSDRLKRSTLIEKLLMHLSTLTPWRLTLVLNHLSARSLRQIWEIAELFELQSPSTKDSISSRVPILRNLLRRNTTAMNKRKPISFKAMTNHRQSRTLSALNNP